MYNYMKQFNNKTIKQYKRGFGLLEVVVAAGILIMVISGVAMLGKMSVKSSVISLDRVQAYNLAEEGAELVRQIRDTNWLANPNRSWSAGLDISAAPYSLRKNVDNSWSLLSYSANDDITMDNKTYKREIFIENPTGDVDSKLSLYDPSLANSNGEILRKIRVVVSWEEYGQTSSTEDVTYLTDWKPSF